MITRFRYADTPLSHYRSTQPCIPPGGAKSSTSFGWGKGGNVTSAGWQVTLCDPMWHVSPVAVWQLCELLYTCYLLTYLLTSSHSRLNRGQYNVTQSSIPNLGARVVRGANGQFNELGEVVRL